MVEATLRLVGLPAEYSAAVATFPSVDAAAKTVFELKRSGLNPAALELLGPECVALMNREEHLDLEVAPTLFIEFHGPSTGQLAEVLETAEEICVAGGCLGFRAGLGRSERDRIFKARHALGEMIKRNHADGRVLIMDVAVPITAYPEILAAMQAEIGRHGLTGYFLSHAGNGNIHLNLAARNAEPGAWELAQRGLRAAGHQDHRAGGHGHRRAWGGDRQAQVHDGPARDEPRLDATRQGPIRPARNSQPRQDLSGMMRLTGFDKRLKSH